MIERQDVSRPLLALAGLAGAIGVALAARGTHAGEADLRLAANFLLLHAPVLLGISVLRANRLSQLAGYVLALGLLLFCGDLVTRAELGVALFPFAAPIGGGAMIVAWLILTLSALFGWRRRQG